MVLSSFNMCFRTTIYWNKLVTITTLNAMGVSNTTTYCFRNLSLVLLWNIFCEIPDVHSNFFLKASFWLFRMTFQSFENYFFFLTGFYMSFMKQYPAE